MTDAISGDARFAATLRARRQKEFRSARRHSILVRILRWGLPGAGVAAVVVFAASYLLTMKFVLNIGPVVVSGVIEATKDGLMMVEPRVTGTSANGEPFVVSATRAWQDAKNSKLIHFETVNAELGMKDGNGRTRLTARKGVYDSEHETLSIAGEVRVKSSEGYGAELHEAFVDFAAGTLKTPKQIVLESAEMRIEAGGASGHAGEQRIEFTGPVRMTIRRKDAEAETGDAAPDSETPPVPGSAAGPGPAPLPVN